MICTRCNYDIQKGQRYWRTKRGAHHRVCPSTNMESLRSLLTQFKVVLNKDAVIEEAFPYIVEALEELTNQRIDNVMFAKFAHPRKR